MRGKVVSRWRAAPKGRAAPRYLWRQDDTGAQRCCGTELTTRSVRIEKYGLPVVIFYEQSGDTHRLQAAGFDGYFVKPVQPSTLLDALTTIWAARQGEYELDKMVTRQMLLEARAVEEAKQ